MVILPCRCRQLFDAGNALEKAMFPVIPLRQWKIQELGNSRSEAGCYIAGEVVVSLGNSAINSRHRDGNLLIEL